MVMSLLGAKRRQAFEFASICLSETLPHEEIRRRVETLEFSWMDVLAIVTDHLVAPAFAFKIQNLDLNLALPETVSRYLDALLSLNRIRNAALIAEALTLAKALNAIGIRPVFLKGAAGQLTGLYKDPAIRILSDIDCLVPASQSDAGVHLLRQKGFAPVPHTHPRPHAIATMTSPEALVAIDFHRDVLAYPHAGLLNSAEVVAKAKEHQINGAHFLVPSPTHQVVLNVAHTQLSDYCFAYGHIPLRAILDLSLLQKKYGGCIDWREIEERFRMHRKIWALRYHLGVSGAAFGTAKAGLLGSEPLTKTLVLRAWLLIGHPRTHRVLNRLTLVSILLKLELSDRELRRRLLKNVFDFFWWRRHLAMFIRGGDRF